MESMVVTETKEMTNFSTENLTLPVNDTISSISKSPSVLKIVSDIVIQTTLVIIMFGMGATIKYKTLWQHLKKPFGIGIGMLSQFVLLPAVTFGLAHALKLPMFSALGMLVMGCCPGGSTSNMFSYWVDGDVALSISMTASSTILAMGMMPLNLLIYSRSWTDESLVIPYANIAKSFAMTIGPAIVGILLRWKIPNAADVVVKFGSATGAVAVLLTLTLISIQYPFMYRASAGIYIGAFLLPLVGFALGYLLSTIFRMEHGHRRTVALETGIQNFPLCMSLLVMTFKSSMFAQIALFPLLYGVTCIVCSVFFLAIYKVVRYSRGEEKPKDFSHVPTCENPNLPSEKRVV